MQANARYVDSTKKTKMFSFYYPLQHTLALLCSQSQWKRKQKDISMYSLGFTQLYYQYKANTKTHQQQRLWGFCDFWQRGEKNELNKEESKHDHSTAKQSKAQHSKAAVPPVLFLLLFVVVVNRSIGFVVKGRDRDWTLPSLFQWIKHKTLIKFQYIIYYHL